MSKPTSPGDDADESPREATPDLPRLIMRSSELFHGRREIFIEHAGELYRLRITSKGRLILTK
ncbi:MAG: hemin uptake protein HemP [Pirellulaceae bacterium]|nr:hemin uptake protein HemP [Pirellulaceae bacterium]